MLALARLRAGLPCRAARVRCLPLTSGQRLKARPIQNACVRIAPTPAPKRRTSRLRRGVSGSRAPFRSLGRGGGWRRAAAWNVHPDATDAEPDQPHVPAGAEGHGGALPSLPCTKQPCIIPWTRAPAAGSSGQPADLKRPCGGQAGEHNFESSAAAHPSKPSAILCDATGTFSGTSTAPCKLQEGSCASFPAMEPVHMLSALSYVANDVRRKNV